MSVVRARAAQADDVAALRALLIETWQATYAPLAGAAAVADAIANWLTIERLAAEIDDPARVVVVAATADALVGVLSLRPGANDVLIDRLYVAPSFQGCGIGRLLIADATRRWPGLALELSVGLENDAARAFYARLGFVEIDRGSHPFGDAIMPTAVMRRAGGPAGLVIAPATRADVGDLVAVFAADALGGHGDTTDPAAAGDYLAAFDAIDQSGAMSLYVARLGGRIVGTFQLLFTRTLTGRGAPRAILEAVQVVPALRGEGIGRAMLIEAERRARVRGAVSLSLTSNQLRVDAHRFYVRQGYAPSHVGFKKALVVSSS